MRTTVGRSLLSSRCSSLRVVSKLVKRKVPEAWSWTQATLLYLPRSMARMVSAAVAAAVVVVVIVQAPVGVRGGWETVIPSGYHGPHGFPMNCLSCGGTDTCWFVDVAGSNVNTRPCPDSFKRVLVLLPSRRSEACRWAAAATVELPQDRPRGGPLLRYQLVPQGCRLPTQGALLLLPHLRFVLLHRLPHVLPAVLQHSVHQAGELVGRRRDRPLAADAALDPSVEQAQRRLGAAQGLRRHPQGDGHPVLPLARATPLLRPVTLVLPRADAQPAGEVLLRREAADVDAYLGQDDQGRSHVDPVDLRQVEPQCPEQGTTGVEAQVVGLTSAAPRLGRERLVAGAVREAGQLGLDHRVALGDLPVVELVQVVGLPQGEQVL